MYVAQHIAWQSSHTELCLPEKGSHINGQKPTVLVIHKIYVCVYALRYMVKCGALRCVNIRSSIFDFHPTRQHFQIFNRHGSTSIMWTYGWRQANNRGRGQYAGRLMTHTQSILQLINLWMARGSDQTHCAVTTGFAIFCSQPATRWQICRHAFRDHQYVWECVHTFIHIIPGTDLLRTKIKEDVLGVERIYKHMAERVAKSNDSKRQTTNWKSDSKNPINKS